MKKMLLAIMVLVSISVVKAQTVDEIIAKHIDALGGKEKLSKLNSMQMTGSLNANGMEISVIVTKQNMVAERQDISVSGMMNFVIMKDTAGWVYFPFQGQTKPEPMPTDLVKKGAYELDIQGVLFNYKEKGNTVEYVGKEDVEGTDCYKLKVTTKSGTEISYFIDPASNMIVRLKSKIEAAGKEQELTVDYSNYKDVDGIKIPFGVTNQFGAVTFKEVKINVPIKPELFVPNTK